MSEVERVFLSLQSGPVENVDRALSDGFKAEMSRPHHRAPFTPR